MRNVNASQLRAACDQSTLGFQSTDDLPALDGMIGQERAVSATKFGIGVKHIGYNLFVLGPPATGKTSTMQRLLAKAAEGEPTAADSATCTTSEIPTGRRRSRFRRGAVGRSNAR